MTKAAQYFKFGLYITATFLMCLLVGSILSMIAPLLGIPSERFFDIAMDSTSSLTLLIALSVFYFHRRVFRRDVFANVDTGHLMVLASTAFLPIFIYLSCVTLIEEFISQRFISLSILGDTLRHNFTVVIPVYFITLVSAGLVFAALNVLTRKFFQVRKK